MSVRVVVAEDNVLVREGIAQLLSSGPGVEVVASCGDYEELALAVEEHAPDVVLTDIKMPPTLSDEGIAFASSLRDSHPDVGVVVLSQYAEPSYVLALFSEGSDRRGYLLKERVHDRATLMSAIRSVADGGSSIDPKIVEVLISARAAVGQSPLRELTSREHDVLAELAQGKSNLAIAESLFLSKRSVEQYVHSIFLKLGLAESEHVSRRVKAALIFLAELPRDSPDAPPASSA